MSYSFDADIFRYPRYSEAFDREFCRASRDEILHVQQTRLKAVLDYCWRELPFYRRLWESAGVSPADIRHPDDIAKFPTWDKEVQRAEIEAHPPFGSYYRDTDPAGIAYLLSSGGTTGTPRIFPIMKDDLPGLQDLQARTMGFIGVKSSDIVQVTTHYSALAGAWCGTWAVEGVGAALVPTGSGKAMPSMRQVDLIHRMGVTVLRSQASYAERLAKTAREMGLDPAAMNVRTIITAGESYSQERRRRIEQEWNAKVYDFFGSSDTFNWSSVDCEHSQTTLGAAGMHVWEDSCIVEVLDEQGRVCAPGEYGEMTITSLNWRNSPRIRYRTGDLVTVFTDRCGCGRNLVRMSSIIGRVDHVVRIRGVNIYPSAIDATISKADPAIREFYAVASRVDGRDELRIVVEWPDLRDEAIAERVRRTVITHLSLTPVVELVPPGSTTTKTGIEGALNKPRRLFDERNG